MRSPIVSAVLMMLMGFSFLKTQAISLADKKYIIISDSIALPDNSMHLKTSAIDLSVKDSIKKKKIVSALFALPFPFGFMGAHRIMLGCKPWIPVVYVATFGGCFGLLPLIDFFVISFSKDIEQYENNPRIFMWIK